MPAAALIRRGLALVSELLGVKRAQAVFQVSGESPELNSGTAIETVRLEYERGEWNSQCRGIEILRYWERYTGGEGGSLARN